MFWLLTFSVNHASSKTTWFPDQGIHFAYHSRGQSHCMALILYGCSFESVVTLWSEELETTHLKKPTCTKILLVFYIWDQCHSVFSQLKYNVFIFSFCPGLNLSNQIFALFCILFFTWCYWYRIFPTKLILPFLPWQALCKKYSKFILVQQIHLSHALSTSCLWIKRSPSALSRITLLIINRTLKQDSSLLSYALGHD